MAISKLSTKPHRAIQYTPFLSKLNPCSSPYLPLKDAVKMLKLSADSINSILGRQIHGHLIITNQITKENSLLRNSLINFYAKCGEVSLARRLFDEMGKRNVVSWCSIMAGYFHCGNAFEVFELFKKLFADDCLSPNEYVFATVISSCSEAGRVEEGKQCHGFVLKSGLISHQYVKNALIKMLARCKDTEGAMMVLNAVPDSNVFSYNLVLDGLLENGFVTEALKVLARMAGESVVWDKVTYVSVFGLCARVRDLRLGLLLHGRFIKDNIECDVFVNTAIIDMYGKCGDIMNAREVFNRSEATNVVSWTAILASYLQAGCFEESLNLSVEMELVGIHPNEYTFTVLLNSCASLSTLKHGDPIHACVIKSGFKDYVIVQNALINMYSKAGDIHAACKVFSFMLHRDVITWNSMISGYSHHGLGREALAVFEDMLAMGERPNYVTFVGVLSACGHLGRVQEGFFYLNSLMKQMGIEPGIEHYTCIVGLLSKAGQLDQAENFMKSMPVKWDVVAWRTLLSACRVHRNYSLAKRVADHVLQLDPADNGTYLLLSNMHAKANRWDGVAKVRKLMKQKNVKKEPGVSWIEIKKETHVFVAEDNKHPEASQIYLKVRELLAKIKQLGYVPDIDTVLHDVEDEQKEHYLSYHSEKLAIAYAIMKIPPEAPIRIIKNLRMCDDCHTAIKLIAKLTMRMIIIRDANRFHCFQDGLCTCADYW